MQVVTSYLCLKETTKSSQESIQQFEEMLVEQSSWWMKQVFLLDRTTSADLSISEISNFHNVCSF